MSEPTSVTSFSMNSFLKYGLDLVLMLLTGAALLYYPRLHLISGFAAKNVCSCSFIDKRNLSTIEKGDNDFIPVSFASNVVDQNNRTVTSSFFGLVKRTAVFREGIGCTLLPVGKNLKDPILLKPRRNRSYRNLAYPYGDRDPVDSLFLNIDYQQLQRAVENAFDTGDEVLKRTRAVLVLYKDHLIAEHYAAGFSKESKFPGWSMTKSITGTVIGIMENQGRISVDQDELFPEWKNSERSKITLDNLLRMNSGLAWKEDYSRVSDVTEMLFSEEDVGRVQLQKELHEDNPWNYSSGTSNLLSRFIRQEFDSHQDYLDFWYSELIDKIGMSSMILETDLAGNYVGSSYAWATARDWAKLGLLYLHNGNWNGEQLLGEDWVDYTTTPTAGSDGEYGAHFWLNSGGKFPNVPLDMYSANGFQGQHVFIIPSEELVVVRLGLKAHPEFNIDRFLGEVFAAVDGMSTKSSKF